MTDSSAWGAVLTPEQVRDYMSIAYPGGVGSKGMRVNASCRDCHGDGTDCIEPMGDEDCPTCDGFGVMPPVTECAFNLGDEVARRDGFFLRSGASCYPTAYVLCVAPLTLVSPESDMVWRSSVRPKIFYWVGRADPAKFAKCYIRRGKEMDNLSEIPRIR